MSARLLHIGRDLQSRVKGFFEGPLRPDATPLELLHAALDELERRVQRAGRGRRVFPYDRVTVHVAQPQVDRAAVEAVFADLDVRLRERLGELMCDAPESIALTVMVHEPSGADPQPLIRLECSREGRDRPRPPVPEGCAVLTIAVMKGQCPASEYVFEGEPVIAIGRTPDPTDAFGVVRHNHVPFLEVRDGVNETVGRAHARLQLDAPSGHYHLFNEGSSNPTSIVRGGTTIRLAPRDPRGVRIQSGDQVQLGRAVLSLRFAPLSDGRWKMDDGKWKMGNG